MYADSDDELDDYEYPDEDSYDDEFDDPESYSDICPNCDANVFDDADYCPNCGEFLSADNSPATIWKIVSLVLLAAIVGAIVYTASF